MRSHAADAVLVTYTSKTANWPHQQQCHDWIVDRFRAGERGLMLALPMGVGKSKLVVDLIGEHVLNAYQRDDKRSINILILCPLSVCNVWPREFVRHLGESCFEPHITVLAGDIPQKQMQVEYALGEHHVNVIVCNYDAAWRGKLGEYLLSQVWNFVIGDESHKFKAIPTYRRKGWGNAGWEVSSGKLAAFMADLSKRAAFRLCLTGTPMAHSPADIFSQFRFLDRGQRYGTSGFKFQQRYGRFGGYGGKEIVSWQNQAEMSRLYNEIAWTCPAEVIQLPEAQHVTREFDLGSEARTAYDDMWATLSAQVQDGEITAQNGAVAFLRLQQITSGIGRLTDGSTVRIDKGKQQLLEEFFDDIPTEEKVVVFCQFSADLAAVKAACDCTPERKYAEISGDAKDGLAADATYAAGANCLGVQLQAGGVGIDLTAARYCIYFSPGLSLANYLQSLKRVHRPGQSRPVTFYHFNARDTIDTRLYDRLEKREDLVEGILALAREERKMAA